MSERQRFPTAGRAAAARLALLALVAGAIGTPVAAQSVEEYRAHVARLERAVADAQIAVDRADSIRRRTLPTDTVRQSGFVIITTSELQGLAREAALLAEPALRATFGDAHAGVTIRPFVVRIPTARQPGESSREASLNRSVELAGLGENGLPLEPWSRESRGAERVARTMVRMAMRGVFESMPLDLRTWLGVPFSPPPDKLNAFDRTYVEMVTQPSQSVRTCFFGDRAHCADALQLRPIADPVTTWYNPDERRLLVRRMGRSSPNAAVREPRFGLCVEKGADRVCDELLRSTWPERFSMNGALQSARVPPPLGQGARESVLHVALRLGGSGAFGRLVDGDESPSIEARLAAAAGVSADSLLSAWRSSVMASRPAPVTLTARIAWTALIWGVFAGALALRSSRWR